MLKTKKSKFIVFSIITLVSLIFLSPLILNYDHFFGIRRATDQNVGDDVIAHVSLNIEAETSMGASSYFLYHVDFDFSSNASVTTVEVSRINYQIYHNTRLVENYNGDYHPSYIISRSIHLLFGDNMTLQGSVDLNYQLLSNPMNSSVNYNLIYNHDIRGQEVGDYILFRYIIFWIYITSFFFMPIVLYFVIHPDFREPSDDEKKEIDEYFEKIRKVNREKRNETSPKN